MSSQSKWIITTIEHNQMKIKTIHYYKINLFSIRKAIMTIDRSLVSVEPFSKTNSYGMIRKDDIICVSKRMIYWFSATARGERVVRSGGGMVAGLWEIKLNEKRKVVFERQAKNGYVGNLLFPGSEPNKYFFGADVYGGYIGSNVVWGLEYSKFTRLTNKFGKEVIEFDKQMYAANEGVFIEFTGLLGNSGIDGNIETDTDTDPRPKVIGRTVYTLTYRIPAVKKEYLQEIKFKSIDNDFGPINAARVAFYLPGYNTNNMVYAADKELYVKNNLKNVAINKYFKNSCTQVYFYDSIHKKTEKKEYSSRDLKLACIGSPKFKIPFLCAYPDLEFLPKETWDDYEMEIVEDQSIPKLGRFHSINLVLLASGKRKIRLEKNKTIDMSIKYKVIPSFEIYDRSKTRIKE